MMPNITVGRGLTGTVAYVMGQGNHPVTGERLKLGEGEASRADILGGQNFFFAIDSAERLDLARRVMEDNGRPENQASKGKKCVKDCLHASLSWEKGQEPSKEDMTAAAQGLLKALGMEKAQAVFVAHHDTAHRHLHIVASRIDPETGKTYSDGEILLKSHAWALRWEREHGQRSQCGSRQQLHKSLDAIEARDGAALVAILTERTPTFTGRELDKMLAYGMADKRELAAFKGEILAQQNVIGLREQAEGPAYRYTTREVLAAEMAVQRSAQRLAEDHSHGLSEGRIAATAAAHTLKPEQAEALAQLAGVEGFAMLWGEAGTGKSHTLNAARAAYEAEGCKVVGMSWTNDVVQQMQGDGFARAATIASELKKIDNGRGDWNANTVLIVDEAAMLSTASLAQLTTAAGHAGAKLILAGDDAQLSSIERGGMFETLRQTHGAATLKEVQRVADAEQKTAFGKMHQGDFREALQTFDKAGCIHWQQKQTDALRAMAEKYTADLAASPDKRRFMFAFTNAEVDALNECARVIHQRRGDLGADHTLATATGAQEFATGDRVQFSGNGRTKQEKNAGLTNGRVGTITGLDIEGGKIRMTVALDTAKNAKPQSVSFVVGENAEAGEFNKFKRGYAGTIYRGQGKTLDESYVCHSNQWKSSAAYVALTRHRESVHIFAATETIRGTERRAASFEQTAKQATLDPAAFSAAERARDLEAMARGMGRKENKRAATAYQIDERHLARAGFAQAAEEATQGRAARQTRQQSAPAAQTTAPAAALHTGKATERAAFTGRSGRSAGASVARGAGRAAKGLLEGLFRALLGESPAPPPRRQSSDEDRAAREQQQRSALEARARAQGLGGKVISEADLRMQEETNKKDRDRGQSR